MKKSQNVELLIIIKKIPKFSRILVNFGISKARNAVVWCKRPSKWGASKCPLLKL